MNTEFKKAYSHLELSEEAMESLLNLKPNEKKVKKYRIRYAAVVAVILGIYFTSDAVTYAATGDTLTQNIFKAISFDKTGDAELKDGAKVHMEKAKDSSFEVTATESEEEDGNSVNIEIRDKAAEE